MMEVKTVEGLRKAIEASEQHDTIDMIAAHPSFIDTRLKAGESISGFDKFFSDTLVPPSEIWLLGRTVHKIMWCDHG